METANGVTTYNQFFLQKEAKRILQAEKQRLKLPGKLKWITWSIRVRNGATLSAQGFADGKIVESSLAL